MLTLEVAQLLLDTFKGREEYIAYCPKGGHFQPYPIPEGGVSVEKFSKHHYGGGSYGVYLLREDSTVLLACVDFDDHGVNNNALEDAQKFAKFMVEQGYPCYLERSQSGSGGHVWFFFESPIPAGEVRVFLRGALADCDMGVEVYPKQAKLTPEQKYGNLIRYPLSGASEFLSIESLEVQEPIAFMSGIQRISVDSLMRKAWWQGKDVKQGTTGSAKYDTEGLPARVSALLDSNSLLLKRWHRDVSGMSGDTSNSALLYAVAVELVRCYVPTPEIEAALTFLCLQWGYEKGLRTVGLTTLNAYQNVIPRDEPEAPEDLSNESSRLNVKFHAEVAKFTDAPITYNTLGVKALNEMFEGGGAFGELTVIAGEPNHGKTSVAYQGLLDMAKAGVPSMMISLEQTEREIVQKHLQRLTDLPMSEWHLPENTAELHRVLERDLSQCATLLFERGGGPNGDDRSLKAIINLINTGVDAGIRCFVVDYLGAIDGCSDDKNGDISRAMIAFNKLVRTRNIDIRLLCQIARPPQGTKGFLPPAITRLAGSASIERNGDNVIGIAYPHKADPERYVDGMVSLYKLKCKNRSSTGIMVTPVAFDGKRQTYANGDTF